MTLVALWLDLRGWGDIGMEHFRVGVGVTFGVGFGWSGGDKKAFPKP